MWEIFMTFDLNEDKHLNTWTSEALLFSNEFGYVLRPEFYEIGDAIKKMQKDLCEFYAVKELNITEISIRPIA